MSREEHTIHVIHLTLVPQRTLEQTSHTGHGSRLVRVGLDADPRVVADAEHVIDDLEAVVLSREVDGGDIGDLGVFGRGVVFQEGHDGDQTGGGSVDNQLVLPNRELLDIFRETRHDVLSIFVQAFGFFEVLVGRVHHGGAEGALS